MKTLEWHPETLGPTKFADAPKLEGWRMPTRVELLALFDSGDFPEEMRDKNFWSSTSYAPVPAGAWVVYFGNGYTNAYSTTNTYYVRLVRDVAEIPEEQSAEIESLRAYLDYIDTDKGRTVLSLGTSWHYRKDCGMPFYRAKTLRDAIDAAREQS